MSFEVFRRGVIETEMGKELRIDVREQELKTGVNNLAILQLSNILYPRKWMEKPD